MRLICVIEDPSVIRDILAHLGLLDAPARAGPRAAVAMHGLDALAREAEVHTHGVDPPCPLD